MGGNRSGRLAVWVLGVVCLTPAGTFAGTEDGAPHYSPWTYRTPLLYRLHECLHEPRPPACYPTGPWEYLILKEPCYIFDPRNVPSFTSEPAAAGSREPAPGGTNDAGAKPGSP